MNSFLELYSSADYRLNNRDYYTSTWEYIAAASDYVIPFQWEGGSDADFVITKIDTDDSETAITGKFFDGSTLVSGWTETTTGTWSITGPNISATDADSGDYITSNTFSLTAKKSIWIIVDETKFSDLADWTLLIKKGAATVYTLSDWSAWNGNAYYVAAATGADYTIVIRADAGSQTITATTPTAWQSKIYNSGAYWWYSGAQLTASGGYFDDIFRLKLAHDGDTFYTDWFDPCEFTDKTKIKVSSSYDYGGIKYDEGYEQWMYKDATVRRSPKAEIEIIGDTLNGERINEKITSAVRYTAKMKCTEAEFEALVHGIGGTIEITDKDGKAYDAQNVELSDPTMYRTNGIVELSFVDGNNINVWHRNLTSL